VISSGKFRSSVQLEVDSSNAKVRKTKAGVGMHLAKKLKM
jgi:hypothetical protein